MCHMNIDDRPDALMLLKKLKNFLGRELSPLHASPSQYLKSENETRLKSGVNSRRENPGCAYDSHPVSQRY